MTILTKSSERAPFRPAAGSGDFVIGGDLHLHRLGFGTMQLSGKRSANHMVECSRPR